MIRLVQLQGRYGRRLALVDEPWLRLVAEYSTVYHIAQACAAAGCRIADEIGRQLSGEKLSYDDVYAGASEWRILPAIDHPSEPARCLVSGTGLTHIASAQNRQAMHGAEEDLTDSMRLYRWGVEGGKPAAACIGVAPEWFYKGCGTILRGHNEPLLIPSFACDGGEEAELAAVYFIDLSGAPRRIGFCAGNEFSDHEFEKRNYLYLAASKLRTCSIGPELILAGRVDSVSGEVSIERNGAKIWEKRIQTGEQMMSHSLANLEHHHFKFEAHRRPGDVHVHYLGAGAFSFGDGVRLQDGDVTSIRFDRFGRALRNCVRKATEPEMPVRVAEL